VLSAGYDPVPPNTCGRDKRWNGYCIDEFRRMDNIDGVV
jgi:hypothetical protein